MNKERENQVILTLSTDGIQQVHLLVICLEHNTYFLISVMLKILTKYQ